MEQQVIKAIDRYLTDNGLTVKQFLLNQGYDERKANTYKGYYYNIKQGMPLRAMLLLVFEPALDSGILSDSARYILRTRRNLSTKNEEICEDIIGRHGSSDAQRICKRLEREDIIRKVWEMGL